LPSRLPRAKGPRWVRYKCRWPGKDVWVYRSASQLLVVRRGFRGWCANVGVWPLPPMRSLDFDDYLQGCLRRLPLKRLKLTEPTLTRFAALDKVWAKHYPSFVAFLSDQEYDPEDGGGKREVGIVTIWATGGFWHLKLRDNDSGHVCYVAAVTLDEALKAADAACGDPAGGWKPEAGGTGKRRR
jgi:hypothetical protein